MHAVVEVCKVLSATQRVTAATVFAKRHLGASEIAVKHWLVGIVVMIGGIFLLDVNLYLGMAVIGVGFVSAKWFHARAAQQVVERTTRIGK